MKRVSDLAVFGGAPVFPDLLYVGRPNVGDTELFIKQVREILASKWLTNRSYVKELEKRVAENLGTKHCIAMCNGTMALEITIRALGLTGEVIVPSFTFIATAHALQWSGITPVFCDIDRITHNLNPNRIEQLLTPQTSGILGVHLWGRPCDVEALTQISVRHNLKLVFDAAHAFGCSSGGRLIGGFGNAEVFSFHATKFFNSFEGGAVVTNDDVVARKVRLMRDFGFTGYDEVSSIGTNGKMNEVSAAMGVTNLKQINDFVAVNRRNYHHYKHELGGVPGVSLLTFDESEACNYQYVVLEIDEGKTIVSRDQLVEILHAENVLARRYFYPACHRMEPYRSLQPDAKLNLPETERMAKRVLCLPTGTAIGLDDVEKISALIRLVVAEGGNITAHLRNFCDSEKYDVNAVVR